MKKEINFFKKAFEKNRLSHLYLIYGNNLKKIEEVLKEFVGVVFKEEDVFEEYKLENNSQIFILKPINNIIRKEQILDLKDEFNKQSLLNLPRIYVIYDLDLISINAANSLLKFLEEPNGKNIYGILLTRNIEKILPTIKSRSQLIKVSDEDDFELYTKNIKKGFDPYVAQALVFLKNFNEELEEKYLLEIILLVKKYIDECLDMKYSFLIELEKNIIEESKKKTSYKIFLELLLINFLDIYRFLSNAKIFFQMQKQIYIRLSFNLEKSDVEKIISLIKEEIKRLNYNINMGISLIALFIKMRKILKVRR